MYKKTNNLLIGIALCFLALLTPFAGGFSYSEWPGSSYSTFVVLFPFSIFQYSDWTNSGWNPEYSWFWIIILPIRLLFILIVILHKNYQIQKYDFLAANAILLSAELIISNIFMNVLELWNVPPILNILMIPAPTIDIQLVIPIPLILVIGSLLTMLFRNFELQGIN